ncbi:formylglycine-generating enzyme family protein [Nodosilinea sp. PGN35]|uniref:formylglycine-generating enzyme family protein n=1 Tax=Nodosilinea sp. PGN35 TaxID=3020489 RepID=UPI0023B241BB|nr:formylglycine-generating enzyme family protein [Nodosilinea sp. TSF1-S3]MDF0369138.1 formylglycine-generating enzyme family protein [Nodosilinea sp. TSF1-S3]
MQSPILQPILQKRQGRNQYYDEVLATDTLPLHMMLIPAGTFLMGSLDDELGRSENESPQHEVILAQFFMAKHTITQAQWRAVSAMPPVNREMNPNPSGFKGDLRPVENMSWYDAVEFCDRLTHFTNRQYRLPTEAEWEYACRAGTDSPFHFGTTITTDIANYCGQDQVIGKIQYSGSYGDGPKGVFREETTPVDQFEGANAFGLCNMHGNVFEWCQDHWNNNYEGCPIDGTAYLTDNSNAPRVARGGSWFYDPRFCRSASRISFEPNNVGFSLGFRVCCSAPVVG